MGTTPANFGAASEEKAAADLWHVSAHHFTAN